MANWLSKPELICSKCLKSGSVSIWPIWPDPADVHGAYNTHVCVACGNYWRDTEALLGEKGDKGMLTELKTAAQKFLQDNRDAIFTIFLLFVVDAYFLNGALRGRLEAMLHKTVDKLEGKTERADVVKT